jgi:hypothetical protein
MLTSALAKTGWAATQRGALWQVTRQPIHSHTPRSSRTLRQFFFLRCQNNTLNLELAAMWHGDNGTLQAICWVAKNRLTFRGEQCRTKNFVANLYEQLCTYGFFVCAKETSMWKVVITEEYTNLRRYSHIFRQYNAEHHLNRGLSFSQRWILRLRTCGVRRRVFW